MVRTEFSFPDWYEGKRLEQRKEKEERRNSVYIWTAWIEQENGEGIFTFEVGKRDGKIFLKAMGENTVC